MKSATETENAYLLSTSNELQSNILSYGGSGTIRTCGFASVGAEFGPVLARRDDRVDRAFGERSLDLSSDLIAKESKQVSKLFNCT